jgi:N-terminal acetyltransferase B complex non-catalytic subunit
VPGAIPSAILLYSSLQIKQIQNDTLSHFLLSRISSLYTDPMVLHQLALGRYIYPANEEETPPEIVLAFTEGTYHNISDFWELWMKLRHSLTRTMLGIEQEFIAMANKEIVEPGEEISR